MRLLDPFCLWLADKPARVLWGSGWIGLAGVAANTYVLTR